MASRTVGFSSIALVALTLGTDTFVFDDGLAHVINGAFPAFEVHDSVDGLPTTVTVVDPAVINGSSFSFLPSIAAEGRHGGRAYAYVAGGRLRGSAIAREGGVIRVSGGSVDGGAGASSFDGRSAALTITGGTFGGTFGAGGTGAEAEARAGSFGRGTLLFFPPSSLRSGDGALVRVSGGTFQNGIVVDHEGSVVTTGGSFNDDPGGISVWAGFEGDASLFARGGTFNGVAFLGYGSHTRIAGGEWTYRHGIPPLTDLGPLDVRGTAEHPTLVEIFGGAFRFDAGPGRVHADENSTVHVYLLEAVGFDDVSCRPQPCYDSASLADGHPLPFFYGAGNYFFHFPRDLPGLTGGYDLWAMEHGAIFELDPDGQGGSPPATIDFTGVSLGPVDFGANIGPRDVGIADMLVRRPPVQTPQQKPFRASVPIEVLALQLASIDLVDLRSFGLAGRDRIFLTLQSRRQPGEPQGKPTVGTRDIDFAMRELESSFDLHFDLRAGSLKGPIIYSGQQKLRTSYPIPWSPEPPSDSIEIAGVNSGFFAGVIGGIASRIRMESDQGFILGASSSTARWLQPSVTLPNAAINMKSQGVVPLTILSAKDFDATAIDAVHALFGPSGAVEAHGKVHAQDMNGDGRADAVMHFPLQDTGLTERHSRACVRGHITSGQRFRACAPVHVKQ